MSFLREIVRDDAIAIAKSCAHGTVEPRHVLWGLLRALDGDAPADIPFEGVLRLLDPHGTSDGPPAVPPEIETLLDGVSDTAAAVALAERLAGELGVTPAGVAGPATAGGPPAPAGDTATGSPVAAVATTHGSGTDTEASILAELDALVGLDEVKVGIRRLLALQHLNEERAAAGLPTINASKHLVFTGDPGTGKTTVAKLVGRLYKVDGLVSKGQLIETGRADLVAGYVGQTALKVQEVVRRSLGGVLFIDEAYALAQGGYADFGDEAIATLVQMMEEHRDDLAVIAAGYSDEMREFIDANPGLRSRFTHYISFPNYTVDELVRIFANIAELSQVTLADGCDEAARSLIEAVIERPDFGNARYVRSLFESAYASMAARALADGAIDATELRDMRPGDIVDPGQGPMLRHLPIGFKPLS
jgi:Cdc6-like AAA superfamily ATPase